MKPGKRFREAAEHKSETASRSLPVVRRTTGSGKLSRFVHVRRKRSNAGAEAGSGKRWEAIGKRWEAMNPDRERVSRWRLLEGEELARLRAQAGHLGHVDRARVCIELDHTTGKTSERIDMVFAPRMPMASSSTGRAADFGPAGSGFEPPLANAPRTEARPDLTTTTPLADPCVPRSVDREEGR